MAHDAFISYSSKDKPTADAACALLESGGVRCWIAPRDILPGRDWGESIVDAIAGSRVMVLIFSAHANESPQVRREVERAVNKGVVIVPFRIENVPLSKSLEYFISVPHWMDAYGGPLEEHLVKLAQTVRSLIHSTATPESVEAPRRRVRSRQPTPTAPRGGGLSWVGKAAVAGVVFAGAGVGVSALTGHAPWQAPRRASAAGNRREFEAAAVAPPAVAPQGAPAVAQRILPEPAAQLPAVPLAHAPNVAAHTPEAPRPTQVTSITVIGRLRSCVIDGLVLHEGEATPGGYTVQKIQVDRVTMLGKNGSTFLLRPVPKPAKKDQGPSLEPAAPPPLFDGPPPDGGRRGPGGGGRVFTPGGDGGGGFGMPSFPPPGGEGGGGPGGPRGGGSGRPGGGGRPGGR